MTVAEKHIQHFNNLNGKTIKKGTLRAFYKQVKELRAPELKELERRLKRGLTQIRKSGRVEITTPLKYKPKSKPSRQPGDIVTNEFLYGLPTNPSEASGEKGLGFTRDGQQKIYNMVTDMIIETMKKEGLFWRLPWKNKKGLLSPGSFAVNFKTKKMYKGINFVVLNYYAHDVRGHKSPYYLTFKQAEEMGGKIRKGAKSLPVFYYNISYFLDKKRITEEQYREMTVAQQAKVITVPIIQYYSVFNSEDITGIKFPELPSREERTFNPIDSADAVIDAMPKRPRLEHSDKTEAYYVPSQDYVHMPNKEWFNSEQEYYATFFHELVHSTGHESRLKRTFGRQGSPQYSFEELVAELGASYLCAETGILYFTLKNSAAYLKGYKDDLIKTMGEDNKFFLKAAAKAQAASDFILDRSEEETKVVDAPKVSRESKRPRLPVERKKRSKATAKQSKKESVAKKPATALAGFTTADKAAPVKETFRLPGVMGDLLNDLQRYRGMIVISGETHSSKSQLGMQIANAFAGLGDDVAWIDWEQGGLDSKDTRSNVHRNVDPENIPRIHVTGDHPETLEAIKALTKHYKVIALDSGTKLKQTSNAWMDQLRKDHPDVEWIIMMQQNEKGGTRGGSAAEFDSPTVIKTYRPNIASHEGNYAIVTKNRGNPTGLRYMISSKQIASPEQK